MCWVLGFIALTHLNSVSKKSRDSLRSSYPAPTWRGSQQIFQVNKYFLQSRYREDTRRLEMMRHVNVGPLAPASRKPYQLVFYQRRHQMQRPPWGSRTTKRRAKTSLVHGLFRIVIGFIILFGMITAGHARPPARLQGAAVTKVYRSSNPLPTILPHSDNISPIPHSASKQSGMTSRGCFQEKQKECWEPLALTAEKSVLSVPSSDFTCFWMASL